MPTDVFLVVLSAALQPHPPGFPDALSATALGIMCAYALAAQGRQRVIDQWSWRHTALKTLDQYWAVLDEHEARGGR